MMHDAKFPLRQLYRAAHMYYLEARTQAQIAAALKVSRPTVSRLLTESRRIGLVSIEVRNPFSDELDQLSLKLAKGLGIERVYLASNIDPKSPWPAISEPLAQAFADVHLNPGDVVVVASGQMAYSVGRGDLPTSPGTIVVPTVGGQSEPEPWHQANEISRTWAEHMGGHPEFIYAPALPSTAMRELLSEDPEYLRIERLWEQAKCAFVGIGAPPSQRTSISRSINTKVNELAAAHGDVCLNFFDAQGAPVEFEGSDRIIRIPLHILRSIPHVVAMATGQDKVESIIGAAKGGYLRRLITDADTALAILQQLS